MTVKTISCNATYLGDFFLQLRPVIEPFWGLISALVTPARPRLIRRSTASAHLVQNLIIPSGDRMSMQLTRVPPTWRARTSFFIFPTNFVEMSLTNHFMRFNSTSSANLRSWCPQSTATVTQKLPGFGLSAQHNLTYHWLASCVRKPSRNNSFQQQFHIVCKVRLTLAQYMI